jgi:hypothetical protein
MGDRVSDNSRTVGRFVRWTVELVLAAYVLGFIASAAYFNWTFARDNGFIGWLLFGEIAPTTKAFAWPYFVTERSTPRELPNSVRSYIVAVDALGRAYSRENVGSPADPDQLLPLLQKAVDSAATTNREDLNRLYPMLGEHFLDDAIAGSKLAIVALHDHNTQALAQAKIALHRWAQWYNPHASAIVEVLQQNYGLSAR